MKVLFLPSWYPNQKSPYDGNFIQNHAKAIALYEKVVVVFSTSIVGLEQTYKIESQVSHNLEEILIYFRYHPSKFVRFYRKIKAYYLGIKSVKDYDLIHSHVFFPMGILAVFLHLFLRKKIIHTEHSSFFHQLSFFQKIIFQSLKNQITHFTPVSQDLKRTLVKLGVDSSNITVIPNTIDCHHFDIQPISKSDKIHFLHISAYQDPRKNVEGMLRVFERLALTHSNFVLEIGGDGDIDWLNQKIKSYQIPAECLKIEGKYSYANLPKIYSQADYFVLFSQFENFGMVLAESICCGTPVIATKVGGVMDFVNRTNGFLLKPSDEEELYRILLRILNEKIGFDSQNVRDSLKDYVNASNVGRLYAQLYSNLLKN